MRIKVIDLLNKIANDDEVPKNFIYDDYYWSWCKPCKIFESADELGGEFNLYKYLAKDGNLNDEIEIIEEEKKIENITWNKKSSFANCDMSKTGICEMMMARTEQLKKSLNEIIEKINKENK